MDKFLGRKRSIDENSYLQPSTIDTNAGDTNADKALTKKKACKSKTRLYQENYLEYGFTWCGDKISPNPKCVVCGEVLANEAMVPSKLLRHFSTKHAHLSQKNVEYFKRLLCSQQKQSSNFTKQFKISDRVKEASYIVAEIIAQQMKPHTIGETLILPSCLAIVKVVLGEASEAEIKKIPLSDDTVRRRINEMSVNIEENVVLKMKEANMYALQVDESTDIGGKAQLLVYTRFIDSDEKIIEQFLCCKEFERTTTGADVFNILDQYLSSVGISWETCVGICTDGAPSMIGSIKGFVSLAKKKNMNIVSTHCFIHREALVAKSINIDLECVLYMVVKMVNYVKSKPLKSRLFNKLCEEMGSQFKNLILHTEVRWLSKGRVLSRFYDLKAELIIFFEEEKQNEYCELLQDVAWHSRLAYLADIFEQLNKLNSSMQGRNENILTSSDKIMAFKDKLKLWIKKVSQGNMGMFSRIEEMENNQIRELIIEHLTTLETKVDNYFSDINVKHYDWIRNPFVASMMEKNVLELIEEEELMNIRNDRTLKLRYEELDLNCFWIEIKKEYPNIGLRALKILLQFSTSHLCELGFSTLVNIKTKKRERLKAVEDEMRVCLSQICPDIKKNMRITPVACFPLN